MVFTSLFPQAFSLVEEPMLLVFEEQPKRCPAHSVRRRQAPQALKKQKVEEPKPLSLLIDLGDFAPESIKISLNGETLTIEGSQEDKDEFSSTTRSFTKTVTLSPTIDLNTLRSAINEKGQLEISGQPKATTRSIQIELVKSSNTEEEMEAESAEKENKEDEATLEPLGPELD